MSITYSYFGDGTTVQSHVTCTAATPPAAAPPPPPSPIDIRAEATRYAPVAGVRTGGTNYLTNTAVVFSLSSPNADLADVAIPPFALGGHRVALTLHLSSSIWTWGDGTTTTYTDDPAGHPYDPADPCVSRAECPDYIAHAFAAAGSYSVVASAHYTGTYSVDGQASRPIPGDIVTTGRPLAITLHTAHSTLTAVQPG